MRTENEIGLNFGRGQLRVAVRADILEPSRPVPVANEREAIQDALENPIGRPPLRTIAQAGDRVAIVVNDITRLCRSDLMLPPIVNTLNEAGVPDSDIFIVFALGIHRQQTDEERRNIVGDEIYRRIRMFDHIATDDANLVPIGTTSFGNSVEINRQVWEADLIILTGEIMYHLITGYSGGRNSLVPGVAGHATATFNHRMIGDARCRAGQMDGNPAHEDLLEACRLVDPDFMVNVILTSDGKLVQVVAGHYDLAHREGCRTVDKMQRVFVDEPYDLIVASAGGFPWDAHLRRAHRGLENASGVLRPGGSILYYAECEKGAGLRAFEDYVYRFSDDLEMQRQLERDFVIGGHKAYWVARLGRLFDVHLVSRLDEQFVRRCHLKPVTVDDHASRLGRLIAQCGEDARIAVIPNAGYTLPTIGSESDGFPLASDLDGLQQLNYLLQV
jgi:nickel-dependent lactate racemase